MLADSTNDLKQVLFDAYGGFADKRIKKLASGSLFAVDDRTERDEDARGRLFPWFCQIFAEVIDGDTVRITMRGDVPEGPSVADWLALRGIARANSGFVFDVCRGEEGALADLANAFRAIVRPGVRYPVASYKYVCPRTAASLDRLHGVLAGAWAG